MATSSISFRLGLIAAMRHELGLRVCMSALRLTSAERLQVVHSLHAEPSPLLTPWEARRSSECNGMCSSSVTSIVMVMIIPCVRLASVVPARQHACASRKPSWLSPKLETDLLGLDVAPSQAVQTSNS